MAALARDYRQDHLKNVVAPVGPPLIVAVTTFFVLGQIVSDLTSPTPPGGRRVLWLLAAVALYGFVPLLWRYARAGRTTAAAVSAMGFVTLLSLETCLARSMADVHWLLMMPYAGVTTMAATLFWSSRVHLALGMTGGMALPTALALHHADSSADVIFRVEFAAAIVAFSCALYVLVHQVIRHNNRLALDAEHRARHDWLTGLANRQYWLELATDLGPERASTAAPISLLYIDIDHFKQTNDQFGHAAGDRHLRRLARTLRAVMPVEAIIGRFGGEEFVVLLPNTPLPQAVAISERINDVLARQDAAEAEITASIGVATWIREESLDQLITRADRAMLEAKARGRRQTVVAGPAITRAPRQARPRPLAANVTSPAWLPAFDPADARMSSD